VPAWFASTTQVPELLNVTVPELKVHDAVLEASTESVTGLLDPPPLAATAKLLPTVAVAGGAGFVKVIDCDLSAVAVPVSCACDAGAYTPMVPAWFASITQVPELLNVTLPALKVHDAVLEASTDKLTGPPGAVADTAKLLPTTALAGGAGFVNEIACDLSTVAAPVSAICDAAA
jgi:hypothetical protein